MGSPRKPTSRKTATKTGPKAGLKKMPKPAPIKVPLRFKAVGFERQMVEMRWAVNGHVMVDYFPVYMPVGAGS